MIKYFLILFFFINSALYAQFKSGFSAEEGRDMIMLCNSYTFLDLYNSDKEIIPQKYSKTYTSPIYGMDNMFQIYENGNFGVINFRGSTANQMSWVENFYSSMIPANGIITIDGKKHPYKFASNDFANVHSGYSLAIVLLSNDILNQIKELNKKGIYAIFITGHSQGGALAHMLRSYLENLPKGIISEKNKFKTYAFASPMIGNKEFSEEYNVRFTSNQTSFSIINPNDDVPNLPLTTNDGQFISSKNIEQFLFDSIKFDYKNFLIGATLNLFDNKISNYIDLIGNSMEKKLIVGENGKIDMPAYQKDIHYFTLEKRIYIDPVNYPSESKEPSFYQHKPYNYYVSFLKKYLPNEYNLLNKKYLPENVK